MSFVFWFCLVPVPSQAASAVSFPPEFLFGLATAPAHVEDNLNDTWVDWAQAGRVAAFSSELDPTRRLNFWTEPEVEIQLAAETGVQVFRLGVDWGRVVPERPGSMNCGDSPCSAGIQDQVAFQRYRDIIKLVQKNKMRVMLTLFHHSAPRWFQEQGGWTQPETTQLFHDFALEVIRELDADVDWWISFNEPTIYALMTYVTGTWPLGQAEGWTSVLNLGFYQGSYSRSMKHIVDAHKKLFVSAKALRPDIQIGVAHHYSYLLNNAGKSSWWTRQLDRLWNWSFPDAIEESVDFVGMNYYGAEFPLNLNGGLKDGFEYSEAGRAFSPTGLYEMLKGIHQRSNKPIWITENGTSDRTDWLRPAYLTEHLAAVSRAIQEGIPVRGYIFWTLSDNWEWADGYCPRFGLVDVDRKQSLKRAPRPSYELFRQIVATHEVSKEQRESSWKRVTERVGQLRPICRAANGVDGLDEPILRPVQSQDWRFY